MKVIPSFKKAIYPIAGEVVYYMTRRFVGMPMGMEPVTLAYSLCFDCRQIEQQGRSHVARCLLRARREIRSIDITRRKD